MSIIESDEIRQKVRKIYAEIAREGGNCCCKNVSYFSTDSQVSTLLGYSKEDISSVPDGADMGLGCGNPQIIAELKEGDTVLDLGCGGGFDCFLAAKKVGKTGKVIGVDMTPEMISKARHNAQKAGSKNVEFRLGEIEYLPIADNSVDVIISNCVINLSTNKQQVFSEAWRVLKNYGRIAISDIVAISEMPQSLKNDEVSFCSCISGAASKVEIEKILSEIGFSEISVELNIDSQKFIKNWAPGSGAENYVCSAIITARKFI